MAVKKTARKKTATPTKLTLNPKPLPWGDLESSNPERKSRWDRGVPVLTKVRAGTCAEPFWNVELDMSGGGGAEVFNMYGAELTFEFCWHEKGGSSFSATINLDDADLFELFKHSKERFRLIEQHGLVAGSELSHAPIPLGLLPEDAHWCTKKEEDDSPSAKQVSDEGVSNG